MRFGSDWTGCFVRGDDAFGYACALDQVVGSLEDPIVQAQIQSLIELLRSSTHGDKAPQDNQVLKDFGACQP